MDIKRRSEKMEELQDIFEIEDLKYGNIKKYIKN